MINTATATTIVTILKTLRGMLHDSLFQAFKVISMAHSNS